jgi:hypothetical protein
MVAKLGWLHDGIAVNGADDDAVLIAFPRLPPDDSRS